MPSLKIAIIYLLTNTINGKRYIGFTTNLKHRLSNHRGRAGKYGYHLANAIAKHGWKAFTVEVLASSKDVDYMKDMMEPYFIEFYNTFHENGLGYNMTHGGEGTFGYKRTPEQCEKVGRRFKGKKLSPERCKQISEATAGENNPNYGKTHSAETRAKISAGIKQAHREGRGKGEWTPERRRRASEVSRVLAQRPENIERMRQLGLASGGKPGHPHTEEHKKWIGEKMKGRQFGDKTKRLMAFGRTSHVWTIQGPEGIVYETCALLPFCKHFGVHSSTIEQTLDPTWVPYRKRRCLWTGLSKRPLTKEERQAFRDADVFWREVPRDPLHPNPVGGQSVPLASNPGLSPH